MTATIIFLAVFVTVVWLYFRWRSARPVFQPLKTEPDDPLMLDALGQAQASQDEFRRLLTEPRQDALVKVRYASSSNQVEHLWAEVVEVLGENELGVRLVTRPVTHSGQLDRMWRCSFEDVEDWQVRDPAGRVRGGFTQRALFAIARRDGIELPKKLLELEKSYV